MACRVNQRRAVPLKIATFHLGKYYPLGRDSVELSEGVNVEDLDETVGRRSPRSRGAARSRKLTPGASRSRDVYPPP